MKRIIYVLLAVAMLLSSCKVEEKEEEYIPHNVAVLFINAGRADSILVQVDDKNYLIDTGMKVSVPYIINALEERNVEKLDGVILTHTHSDHTGGLKKLSKEYAIPIIYSAKISMTNKKGNNKIVQLSEKLEIPLLQLEAGEKIEITDDVFFDVIAPLEYNDDDDNDNSLVLMLRVNGRKILFAGDMQFAEEKTLLKAKVDLKSDVLKVGNHGNKDATSIEFGDAVKPTLAFVTTNTKIDDDSNNEKVHRSLLNATFYITEDADCGYLLTIGEDGKMRVDKM